MGYGLACHPTNLKLAEEFKSGVTWLAGRDPSLNGSPAGFCSDAIALFGVALGTQRVADAELTQRVAAWLDRFIGHGRSGRGVETWELPFFDGAAQLVGLTTESKQHSDAATAETRVALRSRGIVLGHSEGEEADTQQTLLIARSSSHQHIASLNAVVRLAAIDWIFRAAPLAHPDHADVGDVVNLLKRLPGGLRRWTWEAKPRTAGRGVEARRWHIDNEYHVQNLIWFLLAPIFPDLKDEEYLESFGQLHPRADVCIPSLKLVIEVKFLRPGKPIAKIIEEVAADSAVYLSRPEIYSQLLPVIWDDSRRNHEHDVLTSGLLKLPGVCDAVVVSRPGTFEPRTAILDTDK